MVRVKILKAATLKMARVKTLKVEILKMVRVATLWIVNQGNPQICPLILKLR